MVQTVSFDKEFFLLNEEIKPKSSSCHSEKVDWRELSLVGDASRVQELCANIFKSHNGSFSSQPNQPTTILVASTID